MIPGLPSFGSPHYHPRLEILLSGERVAMTGQIFREQFSLYGRQVERWKIDHEEAMICLDVEDLISLGLTVLASLRRWTEVLARNLEYGQTEFSWEESGSLAELFRQWLGHSTTLAKLIEDCESLAYDIAGADNFRRECREVSLMSLDVDKVRRSIDSLRAGQGTPSGQAMDELRHNLR